DSGGRIGRSLVTTMGDVTLGIPFGNRVRPYVTAGAGLIRSHVEDVPLGNAATHHDVGAAFGGGLIVYPVRHLGVRADVRYFRDLSTSSNDPFERFDAREPHYWRTSLRFVIR